MTSKSNPKGRPLTYKTPEDMQRVVDDYFKSCEGVIVLDKDDTPLLDKYSNLVYKGFQPPTVTGLALALGFNSRQSLLNYAEREDFLDTITHAKSRVEAYTESRLFDRDGSNGAKWSLERNFKGYAIAQDINVTSQNVNIDVTEIPSEERGKMIQELLAKMGRDKDEE